MSEIHEAKEQAWEPVLLRAAQVFVKAVYEPPTGWRALLPSRRRQEWKVPLIFDLQVDWPALDVTISISTFRGEDVRVEWVRGSDLQHVSVGDQRVRREIIDSIRARSAKIVDDRVVSPKR